MIEQAIQKITTLAQTASGNAQLFKIHDHVDPDKVVMQKGAEFEVLDRPDPVRDHAALSLESLIRICRDRDGESIWHDNCQVVVLFDDEKRKSRSSLVLETSALFDLVKRMANDGVTLNQKSLIKLLKGDLRDVAPGDLLTTVRTLNFKKNEETRANELAQASSLGRSIERSVTGAATIPEQFDIETQVYVNANPDFAGTVTCNLDVDLETQLFSLHVSKDDLAGLVDEAHKSLGERIDTLCGEYEIEPKVYFGTP